MTHRWRKIAGRISLLGITMLLVTSCGGSGAGVSGPTATGSGQVRLPNHVPVKAIAAAVPRGREDPNTAIQLVFSLPLRDPAGLEDLLRHIYNPADPLYGHYLSPKEFTDRFGPTQADYDAVAAYARGAGLTITGTPANRTVLDATGPARVVESAFKLQLNHYQAPDGHEFYAPDRDPEVPASIASRIVGVIGLDNAAVWHTQSTFAPAANAVKKSPLQIGTGPGSALAPNDILTAYNLKSVAANGSGQTLALFELDGYTPSDVNSYETFFSLPAAPLQNVLVDGFTGAAGSGASEVTLDIELMAALSPGASKIIVYEGPNTGTGVVDTYNKIAVDNLAGQISTSWGLSEGQSGSSLLNSENTIFQQMAAQGQSIYAASGDSGAYDNGTTLSVDDPASQPYMVGTGGTQLFVSAGEIYSHESSWNVNNTVAGGAGGGGISSLWSIPSWQQGIPSVASTTMRNVPDISLNADQFTGYAVFYQGAWQVFGGTSCAAPLWAAFTALVNEQRASNGSAALGFANPTIYQLASGPRYGADFFDIADNSTNLFYHAITGYDNSTGWGSFNGANLLADLAPVSVPTAPPAQPTGLSAATGNVIVTLSWASTSGATSYSVYRGTTPGGESASPIAAGITTTAYADTAVVNGTTYYYQVSASNSVGTSPLSAEVLATPLAHPLRITRGAVVTPRRLSAVIVWYTNVAADSVVVYGTSPAGLTQTASGGTLVKRHKVILSGLARKTKYYYRYSSTRGSATILSKVVRSFRTL